MAKDISEFKTVKLEFPPHNRYGFPANEKVEVQVSSAGPGWAFINCERSKVGLKAFIIQHKGGSWKAGEFQDLRVFAGQRR